MSKKLTKRQEDVLKYIKKYVVEHGYPPAIREIGDALGLSSPATVHSHLNRLVQNGYLKKTSSKFRTLEVLGNNEFATSEGEIVKVPLLGKVTAGNPIEAIEKPNEFFDLPASLIPKRETVFVLEVNGDSMINKGIFDRDIVIVKKQDFAHSGDTVVAMNENDEVTLKTFYREKGYIRLQPENDTMQPIILSKCKIVGIAIGLYRKL